MRRPLPSARLRIAAVVVIILAVALGVARAAVELNFFVGAWNVTTEEVTLTFETGSEVDHSFFDVWRSTSNLPIDPVTLQINTSQAERLNIAPIINPDGFCAIDGHLYTYVDDTVVASQGTYFYYLESFPCAGGADSEFSGDGLGGLAVSRPGAVPPPSSTPTPSATAGASSTPDPQASPTNTLLPTVTNTPAPGSTSTPSPTGTTAATASPTSSATTTPAATTTGLPTSTPRPSATSAPAPPGSTATSQSLTPTPPLGAVATLQPSGPEVASPTASPQPTVDLLATAGVGLEGQSRDSRTGPALVAGMQVSTPTVLSRLAQAPDRVNPEALTAASQSPDPLDRLMQGIAALLLVGAAALIGLMGWIYIRP